ncbi:Targeting complex (TRAPP) subunit [Phytophthora cinnamomi]|uniref:Targeting complex (TRAPP) subunit n=1 Tax=Phytophthora cinnamomi TaxID=4785 RepID=UPI003559C6F5|nr:Targeting complex (TRAPP) subunit [Phytophthora cinnamomi]
MFPFEGLGDLVVFPVHHELQGTDGSTVSLHLQAVMDTLAVNVEPQQTNAMQQQQSVSSPVVLSRDVRFRCQSDVAVVRGDKPVVHVDPDGPAQSAAKAAVGAQGEAAEGRH